MESRIVNVENIEFPAVSIQRLPVWVLQQNVAKWGPLTEQFQIQIYLFTPDF